MPRILLTAFEPYDPWRENSSWLALIELTRWFEGQGQIVTRRYPVNLDEMTRRMTEDLRSGFDFAIHVGQFPGAPVIRLESTGCNTTQGGTPIIAGAPSTYRSSLPLANWAERIVAAGIPVEISHQAGTDIGNTALYLCQHVAAELDLDLQCCFVHVPLAPHQVSERLAEGWTLPSMSLPMTAYALSIILTQLLETADE